MLHKEAATASWKHNQWLRFKLDFGLRPLKIAILFDDSGWVSLEEVVNKRCLERQTSSPRESINNQKKELSADQVLYKNIHKDF